MMPELVIYPAEAKDQVYKIWPLPDPVPPGVIREAGSYYFELRNVENPFEVELLIDDIEQEALRPKNTTTALWKWQPGFHAGKVEAGIRFKPNHQIRFEFVTDPDVRKLTRSDYDTMVAEILEDTFALFSLSSFKNGVARGTGKKPPPIARLEFLRSRIELISKALIDINNRPRRVLRSTVEVLPYYKVRNVTGIEILRSFHSGRALKDEFGRAKLPALLRGHIPAHIRKNVVHSALDIREHREIKSALKYWSVWLHRIEARISNDIASKSSKRDSETVLLQKSWTRRIKSMRKQLQSLLNLPVLSELPDEPLSLKLSSIYRNVPAYRDFYRLYRDMNMGITNIFGDFLQVPLARTYDLYELWCFLRLLRTAINKWGTDKTTDDLFSFDPHTDSLSITARAVQIPVGNGLLLSFQRRYEEYWLAEDESWVGTFSRTMIPDITLTHEDSDNLGVIVLDSKYRIDSGLNDALTSIHTYRDAIVHGGTEDTISEVVKAAYLLCPRVKDIGGEDWKAAQIPGRLFHPQYRDTFRFGAVILRPGMTERELSGALDSIIKDVT